MTRVSIELVPRNEADLREELAQTRAAFPGVQTINIPDLPRFELRSWTGCAVAREYFAEAIPHIRARDIDLSQPLPMIDQLREQGTLEVLVIAGDPPPDAPKDEVVPNSVEVIKKFKREASDFKVYAAIDPYRSSFRSEWLYCREKLEAGADGFFTQPFFDRRLMAVYAELLPGETIFWGVAPVTTANSRAYWEKRNKAIFPGDFEPSLEWNQKFARDALAFARETEGSHIYFMPILLDVEKYLTGVI